MKKLILILNSIAIFCFQANAQFLYHIGPVGSFNFGSKTIVLTNGNYVISDPYYSSPTTANVGAVYLYDGVTNSLIGTITGSSAGDKVGDNIVALTDGKFAILSPYWKNGANTNAGAVTICSGTSAPPSVVDPLNSLVGRNANDYVGQSIVILPSGNYVINSFNASTPSVANCGASTWVSKLAVNITGYIDATNSLVGTRTGDFNGGRCTVLKNGNYVLCSDKWDAATDGTKNDAGCAVWCDQGTGRVGTISAANALVGDATNDNVGSQVVVLENGNYFVYSPFWKNLTAGAVTWGNGTSGTAGVVSTANSLVGGVQLGYNGLYRLSDGNCIIVWVDQYFGTGNCSLSLMNGSNGKFYSTDTYGNISSSNSIIGIKPFDFLSVKYSVVGTNKYLLAFPYMDNASNTDVGAIRLFSTPTDWKTSISSSNAIIGPSTDDRLGSGDIVFLSATNYALVGSPNYTYNAKTACGALTVIDVSSALPASMSATNSIYGSTANDNVGYFNNFKQLAGNKFLLYDRYWDNGAAADAGFVYSGDASATQPVSISSTNALVGSSANDVVGTVGTVKILSNGNYVASSPSWDDGALTDAGAVTWGSGTTGITGAVSSTNSIIGSHASDRVGYIIFPLSNGNYVIGSPNWDNGTVSNAGAITWCNGSAPTAGTISSSNSVVGTIAGSNVGIGNPTYSGSAYPIPANPYFLELPNNKYVAKSYAWTDGGGDYLGAEGMYSSTTSTTGTISSENSLVGNGLYQSHGYDSRFNDVAASNGLFLLFNESYSSNGKNGNGSVTLADANGTLTGFVNKCNSFIGTNHNQGVYFNQVFNNVHNYFLVGNPYANKVAVMRTPQTSALALSNTSATENVSGYSRIPIVSENCQIIAAIQRDNPATGTTIIDSIKAKVWIETNQYPDFVKRHFELTPSTNPATATGKVTLYCTQQEFNSFNSLNTIKLPATQNDILGKSNLRIAKYAGTSSNSTGAVNTYPSSTPDYIDPDDADIVWNATANGGNGQWEITFPVAGFSGFFITTKTFGPLPLQWLSLTGKLDSRNIATVNWQVQESNVLNYEIEFSEDATVFKKVGNTYSKGNGNNLYQFTDATIISGTVYYRIKQIDRDGKYSYSNIVRLSAKDFFPVALYPNPADDVVTINVGKHLINTEASLLSASGLLISKWKVEANNFSKNISTLASGVYLIKFADGTVAKFVKE